MESNRGPLLLAGCSSASGIAGSVAQRYRELLRSKGSGSGVLYLDQIDTRFQDSETTVRLETHVGGYDVFLFQSLFNPTRRSSVDENYMAFVIAARTFKEHGANRITGVLPYLAYSRQDKPTRFKREPTTAQLMADLSIQAGMSRLVTWHPHSDQIHGFYGKTPINALDPLSFFVREFSRFRERGDVIAVAPDAGASNIVTHLCRTLKINGAIAAKHRPRPEEAEIEEIIGDFSGKKTALVIDDIIGSAGTLQALVKKLAAEKDIAEIYVAASHCLCVGKALERLKELHSRYHLRELIITDTVPQPAPVRSLPFLSVRSLADDLCRTINRIHYNRSVSEVFFAPGGKSRKPNTILAEYEQNEPKSTWRRVSSHWRES
jgi:ribose-phosphate pyrophosphokinase